MCAGQKRVLDPLKQELEMAVSCPLDAGTEYPLVEEPSVLLQLLALYSERNFKLTKKFQD